MAVTRARKAHLYRYGFVRGTSFNTIYYWPTRTDWLTERVAGSARIAIYAADGTTVKLAQTAMTAQAADLEEPPYNYVLDLSNTTTWPLGQYQIEFSWLIVGQTYGPVDGRRRMGIYPTVPSPLVTDQNLTAIVFDLNDFIGDRSDWTETIESAWNLMLVDLARIRRPNGAELDPYEIADSTELLDLHTWKCMELVALELRSTGQDRFGQLFTDAKENYQSARESFEASQLAKWGAGPVATDERYERNRIRSHVKEFGVTNSAEADRSNDSAPPVTMGTRW